MRTDAEQWEKNSFMKKENLAHCNEALCRHFNTTLKILISSGISLSLQGANTSTKLEGKNDLNFQQSLVIPKIFWNESDNSRYAILNIVSAT